MALSIDAIYDIVKNGSQTSCPSDDLGSQGVLSKQSNEDLRGRGNSYLPEALAHYKLQELSNKHVL